MTHSTITAAANAVANAEKALLEAGAKAQAAQQQAQAARSAAAHLQARLSQGDSSVSVEEIVAAGPEADRLETLAGAYGNAITGVEHALRVARTDAVLARVRGGEIRPRHERYDEHPSIAAKLADNLDSVEASLEQEQKAMNQIMGSLQETTAYDSSWSYRYPQGDNSSPIQMDRNGSFEVDSATFDTFSPENDIESILDETKTEMARRRRARREASNSK